MRAVIGILCVAALTSAFGVAEGAGKLDLDSRDLCAAVPADAVVKALGGKVLRPAATGHMGKMRSCTYEIQPGAKGTYAQYIVYAQPPNLYEGNKELQEPATIKPLAGLGDDAYQTHDEQTGQYRVEVLRSGVVYVEVIGDRAEATKKLAALVLSKL
jgi:hypothetical protein